MTRIVVVLPAPLGPRNPVTRPGWQTKLTSSTAVNAPYFRVSPSTLIMCPACPNAPASRASAKCHGRGPTKVGVVRRPAGACAATAVGLALRAEDCDRPAPEAYQPRLTPVGARLAAWSSCSAVSAAGAGCPIVRATSPAGCWRSTSRWGWWPTCWSCFRRRWPVPIALLVNVLAGVSGIASGPAVLAVGLASPPGAGGARSPWSARSAFAAAQFFVGLAARPRRRLVLADARRVNAIATAAMLGVGHVHRLPPRADLDPAAPRRARRVRAGAPGRPGAGQRAGPDRPRDARRARPPDLPGLHARRRARLPRGPRRPSRCAPAPP